MREQYPNWNSIKVLIRIRLCLKLMFKTKFDSLARTDSLFPAFLHKEDACSLQFRFLSISKPNTFCLLLSQTFLFPILAQTFSFLYPETSSWHLSWFNSCYYFQTMHPVDTRRRIDVKTTSCVYWTIARKLLCSSLFIKEFKSISQA